LPEVGTLEDFDLARLIETGSLKTLILDRNRVAAQFHPDTETVSFTRDFPDSYHEFTGLITISSIDAKYIAVVAVIPFVK